MNMHSIDAKQRSRVLNSEGKRGGGERDGAKGGVRTVEAHRADNLPQ